MDGGGISVYVKSISDQIPSRIPKAIPEVLGVAFLLATVSRPPSGSPTAVSARRPSRLTNDSPPLSSTRRMLDRQFQFMRGSHPAVAILIDVGRAANRSCGRLHPYVSFRSVDCSGLTLPAALPTFR